MQVPTNSDYIHALIYLLQRDWLWWTSVSWGPCQTQAHSLRSGGQHCPWWRTRPWQGSLYGPHFTQGSGNTISTRHFVIFFYTLKQMKRNISNEIVHILLKIWFNGVKLDFQRLWMSLQGSGKWYELQDLHVADILPQMITLSESYIQVGNHDLHECHANLWFRHVLFHEKLIFRCWQEVDLTKYD